MGAGSIAVFKVALICILRLSDAFSNRHYFVYFQTYYHLFPLIIISNGSSEKGHRLYSVLINNLSYFNKTNMSALLIDNFCMKHFFLHVVYYFCTNLIDISRFDSRFDITRKNKQRPFNLFYTCKEHL